MPNDPILVVGSASPSDPGQTVVGTGSNNTQTDSYLVSGFNNTITEDGGNLDVNSVSGSGSPNTTIDLGHAVNVADTIDLGLGPETIVQASGKSLTISVVDVALSGSGGNSTVSLVNKGGTNNVNIAESSQDDVTLTGAINIVTGGLFSIITLNGNAENEVTPVSANVTIGKSNDRFFGYTTSINLGAGGDIGLDNIFAGDENVVINGIASFGFDVVALGNGDNIVALSGDRNLIAVGSGVNAITLSGSTNNITVTDTAGHGSDVVNLNSGTADVVTLGTAGGTITGTGAGTTTITQAVSSRAAVQVNLNTGTGIVTLGNGNDGVTSGANSHVTVGTGNDTLSVGAGSTLLAGAGHDTITIGDHSTLDVAGSNTSKTTINLGNDDVVGVTDGQVITNDSVGNDLIYLDGVSAKSMINFTSLDDSVVLGSNASARVFLDPAGGDLVEIQAPDATGSYTGTVDVKDFTNDIFYVSGLVGKSGESLNSFSAVVDDMTQSGANQILSLQGGGEVVFQGHVHLNQSEFAFLNSFGPVVPAGL